MQQHFFSGWQGNRRFVIAVIALVVVLVVTLGAAIYSYINAYNTMTTLGQVQVSSSPNSVTIIDSNGVQTTTPIVSEGNTSPSESEATVKATITTNSNSESSVVINGEKVEVPESGTVQQEVPTEEGGNATVNIQVNSSNAEDSETRSKLNIKYNSTSEAINE